MLAPGEIDALRNAAARAWDDDTRHPDFLGYPSIAAGQCYVTSSWLAQRLGGSVAIRDGHFFWVSSGRAYGLDLTGDVGPVKFELINHFAGYRVVEPSSTDRAKRFAKRANRHFDNLEVTADLIGDALPAEEPQVQEDTDQRYFHDDVGGPASGEYNFVYAHGQFEISPFHGHDDLASHAGVQPDHSGPFAAGTIDLQDGSAFWHATSNASPRALLKVMKDYTKTAGWSWGGLTAIDGSPIDDEIFMGKSSSRVYFAYTDEGECLIVHRRGRLSSVEGSRIIGYLQVEGQCAKVQTLKLPPFLLSMRSIAKRDQEKVCAALLEWCQDNSVTLLAANDNVVKTIEDLEMGNLYDPNPTQEDDHQYPERYDRDMSQGTYSCDHCGIALPTYQDLLDHQLREEHENPTVGEPMMTDGGMPELRDPDNPSPSNRFEDQFPYVSYVREDAVKAFGLKHQNGDRYMIAYNHGPVATIQLRGEKIAGYAGRHIDVVRLMIKRAFENPKFEPDVPTGPIPFIYDIDKDTITTGQPGARTSDIPGKFTAGGIVDGVYNPDGKCVIHTFTNMPWTANYFLKLWYSNFPTLQVKSLHLQDDGGGDTRLAGSDWSYE